MVGKTIDISGKLPTAQLVNSILGQAIDLKANYIHIEPGSDYVLIRLRINGSLQEINRLPKKRFDSLVERVKSLANLRVAEKHIPQDGRFKFNHNERPYTLRVSILPTIYGEKVVINIINEIQKTLELRDLGYWGTNLANITKILDEQSGLILVVGPNDSGKSTTLFSMLSNINPKERTIATIEDPVEYRINGAHQTQVNHKANLGFVTGLQAILKHDVNVIMISELREPKVAKLAFNIASRGKLIVSSIFANTEFDAIELLANSGISNNMVAHVLKVACSQRLVRKLCTNCRKPFEPDKNTLTQISTILANNKFSEPRLHQLEIKYQTEKLALSLSPRTPTAKDLSTTEGRVKRLWRASDNGCSECFNSGYSGRINTNELLINTDGIEKLISTYASKKVIKDHAIKEGMIPIEIDCLIKALAGDVGIGEVFNLALKPLSY